MGRYDWIQDGVKAQKIGCHKLGELTIKGLPYEWQGRAMVDARFMAGGMVECDSIRPSSVRQLDESRNTLISIINDVERGMISILDIRLQVAKLSALLEEKRVADLNV